jgi:hypothetical protein
MSQVFVKYQSRWAVVGKPTAGLMPALALSTWLECVWPGGDSKRSLPVVTECCRFARREDSAEDLELIHRHNRWSRARTEVQPQAIAGLGTLGELTRGDQVAIQMQALAAGAHGGDDVVPVPIMEGARRFERFVAQKLEPHFAAFQRDQMVAPAVVVARVTPGFAEPVCRVGGFEPEAHRVISVRQDRGG